MKKVGDGVFEMVVHPGYFDDDLVTASTWNKVRENDYKVLRELAEEGWIEKEGINLVRYPNSRKSSFPVL